MIVTASEPKQPFAISVNVVAVQEPFAAFGHHRPKAEFAVAERQVPCVFAVAKSAPLLLVIRPSVLVPEQIERIKHRLSASEQKVHEPRFALRIEAHNLAIKNAPTSSQVTSEPVAQAGEGLEHISVAEDESHTVFIGKQQCPKSVPFKLKNPVWMGKRLSDSTEGYGLELRKGHRIQYSEA